MMRHFAGGWYARRFDGRGSIKTRPRWRGELAFAGASLVWHLVGVTEMWAAVSDFGRAYLTGGVFVNLTRPDVESVFRWLEYWLRNKRITFQLVFSLLSLLVPCYWKPKNNRTLKVILLFWGAQNVTRGCSYVQFFLFLFYWSHLRNISRASLRATVRAHEKVENVI